MSLFNEIKSRAVLACTGVLFATAVCTDLGLDNSSSASKFAYKVIHFGSQIFFQAVPALIGRCLQRKPSAQGQRIQAPAAAMAQAYNPAAAAVAFPQASNSFAPPGGLSLMAYEEEKNAARPATEECQLTQDRYDSKFIMYLGKGNNQINFCDLVISLLSQSVIKNPFTNKELEKDETNMMAVKLGIDPDHFVRIWSNARNPAIGPSDIDPQKDDDMKTKYRFIELRKMLKEDTANKYQRENRISMLTALSQYQAWVDRAGNV